MRITAVYRIACSPEEIGRKAEALAIEQSVEMPLEAIADRRVREEVVGRVASIAQADEHAFRVRVELAAETAGGEAGQLMNMLFGNSSLHADIALEDVELPPELLERFGGPQGGASALKRRAGGSSRALTCAAIKPLGLPAEGLAALTLQLGLGGIDYIKDDHALADQSYAPFAARLDACADAARRAADSTGRPVAYVPNVSGDLDSLRRQVAQARSKAVHTLLIAPMLSGLPAFHAITRENPDMSFIAHPALAGAARIDPALLLGKLFRLFGADAVIFPHHGGRFGYSAAVCTAIADAARGDLGPLRAAMPVPAGGMTLDRLPEILKFYGNDTMILIGGALLSAGERLTEEAALFTEQVVRLSAEE